MSPEAKALSMSVSDAQIIRARCFFEIRNFCALSSCASVMCHGFGMWSSRPAITSMFRSSNHAIRPL